jgi:hypothetical protein
VASRLSVGSRSRCHRLLRGSPDHVSSLSRRTTRIRVRPVIHDHQQEGADQHGRSFPLPFGCRHRLLGHPVSAEELGVPHGRLTGPERPGPRRGFHVSHAQDATGEGALYSPGTVVLFQADHDHRPAPGASQRRVPAPRHNLHHYAAPLDEPSTRVQAIRPSGLPLACGPRMEHGPLGFLPGFVPRDYSQRTPRRGRIIEHRSETSLYVIDLTSNPASFA